MLEIAAEVKRPILLFDDGRVEVRDASESCRFIRARDANGKAITVREDSNRGSLEFRVYVPRDGSLASKLTSGRSASRKPEPRCPSKWFKVRIRKVRGSHRGQPGVVGSVKNVRVVN